MRKALGMLVIIGVALMLALILRQSRPTSEAQLPQGEPNTPSSTLVEPAGRNNNPDPQELTQLEADLAEADSAVMQAQAQLDNLSGQLDLIEAQVTDIESRGDDPADYADEVLPYMQPVLDEFLDAQSALDEALERQQYSKIMLTEALKRAEPN